MHENFATILETVAEQRADRTAVTRGAVSLTWQQLEERAARLAAFLADRGVGTDDRVAIALYNGPGYVETLFAALKLRAVPVNINYRYQAAKSRMSSPTLMPRPSCSTPRSPRGSPRRRAPCPRCARSCGRSRRGCLCRRCDAAGAAVRRT